MVIWGEELTWTFARKNRRKKKTSPLFIFGFIAQPAASVQDPPFLYIYFFWDYTPFIRRSSISRLRPKCCWSNKDNYAANLHKTMCWPHFTFFGGGGRANYTSNRQGGIKKRKRRGEYCKCGISPSPRASQHNATLDKWAKSQTNLKRDSFHSAAAEEREAAAAVGREGRGGRRKRCQLFHPLTDSDCHGRKTDECFSDLWCFAVHIKCRLCSSGDTLKS